MAKRTLRATAEQVERAKAAFETFRDSTGFPSIRPTPSRHVGGDLGNTAWAQLDVAAQELWVKIGDRVAVLCEDQLARRKAS